LFRGGVEANFDSVAHYRRPQQDRHLVLPRRALSRPALRVWRCAGAFLGSLQRRTDRVPEPSLRGPA
jgi:hypothetical protein